MKEMKKNLKPHSTIKCVDCGGPIPKGRVEILLNDHYDHSLNHALIRCVKCQEKQEEIEKWKNEREVKSKYNPNYKDYNILLMVNEAINKELSGNCNLKSYLVIKKSRMFI